MLPEPASCLIPNLSRPLAELKPIPALLLIVIVVLVPAVVTIPSSSSLECPLIVAPSIVMLEPLPVTTICLQSEV